MGVSNKAVTRLARKAEAHAPQSHEEHVAFSPKTREVQLDEKWSFVGKKEKNCDINNVIDKGKGDQWDHTAIDAETRLMISVVVGRRTLKSCVTLVQAVKDKTKGRTDMLFTTDEHAPYKTAISKIYQLPPEIHRGNVNESSNETEEKLPADLCYATIRKVRKQGRIIEVISTLVFGILGLFTGYRLSHALVSE